MDEINHDLLFKKGIWIKEQNGTMTLGSLDQKDSTITIIPETLAATLHRFENDIIDALYGEDRIEFNPDVVNIDKLFENLQNKYSNHKIRVVFLNNDSTVFKGNYDKIFSLMDKMVSISLSSSGDGGEPIIYINASLLDNHLCIIYRDSDSVCNPSEVIGEIEQIKTELQGEINFKATEKQKSYFDIMIPSQ